MKRLLDIIGASLGLLLLSPVMLLLMVRIGRDMGKPVLFRQTRPGKDAKPFEMIKFRSMRDAVDEAGEPLPDAQRITPLGQRLRSSSLDELPELWNVLKGEMSLVGPRPLLMEYVPLYTPEQARRMEVRPGITGWAQVNGRNAISWDEKFKLDIWYVDNRTLWLDLKILWMTVLKVVRKDGISAEGEATMTKFTGS
ncbi:sugar transferase [Roseovarius nubinhibens]|uniref:sugar transferase n=1 Tax=Roseovarius nubinhibens TaxID=314263 RepID=UPI001C0902A2|nr:sugar transferase [Roseovarius nubinhibens]MBU2999824.1 sugar transferase [Roseovarius nubinhibens]